MGGCEEGRRRRGRPRLRWEDCVKRCEEGRRRRGRPRLRWEDCVKRDVRKAGGDEGGQG